MRHLHRMNRFVKHTSPVLLTLLVLAACTTGLQGPPTDRVAAYSEQHRPQFHFSPPAQWMNDPNGMVYYAGEYHLFYQYYPGDIVWGPMHWGHAVSTDLVHWSHLPIALHPDELGYIFSGSAVVDWHNSSGFGENGEPPLVAVYTYHNPELAKAGGRNHEYQAIAWSKDRGRSWTKYAGNPVLPNSENLQDFRDPKVFWHEQSEKWVMALSATDHVQFWGSANLRDWYYLSEFGRGWGAQDGVWECPDLVELRVADTGERRWVLILNLNPGGPQGGSGTQYFVGDFDGRQFTLDDAFKRTLQAEGAVWLDTGRDSYAGVTWSDIPQEDGRTLFMGWMSNWDYAQEVPTHPWRSAMTLPRELWLEETGHGYRVYSRPAAELKQLRDQSRSIHRARLGDGEEVVIDTGFPITRSELKLEYHLLPAGSYDFGVELSNTQGETYRIGYTSTDNLFYSDRTAAGDASFSDKFAGVHRTVRLEDDGSISLHLFFDSASVELFADDGANVMTDIFFPTEEFTEMRLYSRGDTVELMDGEIYSLKSIWR